MTQRNIAWPIKTRELHTQLFDSGVWNDLVFRDDDIIISTWAKSGTTWVQQIVAQLIFGGAEDLDVAEMSPWLDLRVPPAAEKLEALGAQTHRRFIKTHLPLDTLVYSPKAKYLYIGRDGRDVMWSMHNHWINGNAAIYSAINDTPGRVGPPIERPPESVRDYFLTWLERDGYPFHPFWASLEHCSFDYMKVHATRSVPLGGAFWEGGAQTFIHKGTNGRWRDQLTEADCRAYDEIARRELGEACANWLATGKP